ncbi:MAG: flagella basal body P-ring formation protein FlgA [Novosphingobium sp.]|nr:flagella basal body P-ring formation protein FlgA [Novosphingobium sp.]
MTFIGAILLATAGAPTGNAFADLDALDRDVASFTGAQIGAPGGAVRPLDRRLRLRACLSQVALEWRTPRRDTVVLRCPNPGGWRLFVPVMAIRTPGLATSAQAAVAINRGDAVSLAVTGSGFSVSRPAEALEPGGIGDWIRVRPVTERRSAEEPVRARVVRPGLVALPAG